MSGTWRVLALCSRSAHDVLMAVSVCRQVSPGAVTLARAWTGDRGVWACVALGATGEGKVVLRVWALAVRRPLAARRTLPLQLHCGALQLALLYDHLQVSWTLNGHPFNHTVRNADWGPVGAVLRERLRCAG